MTQPDLAAPAPPHAVQVFATADVYVTAGANVGDGIGGAEDVCAGDVYQLDRAAAPMRLMLRGGEDGVQTVAPGSDVGAPGDPVTLSARHTLMAADGERVEVLILRHRGHGRTSTVTLYALPLSPLAPRVDYTLIASQADPAEARLHDLLCVSFARGTRITLATGEQRAIEALAPGDRVLTRDHGPQPVRWIGRATLRAQGSFAPVVIAAGAMGNAGDLIVSPHHRIFLYQRDRAPGLPTSEILVQAKHLADGETIFRREGGVVDYFSLVFDRHEIVYAEGIPAESLLVTEATVTRLPEEMAAEVRARFPGLAQVPHFGTEAGREALALLRPHPARSR
ncbi:MAG: Hint domain-containing protein [Rhodobacterales bacterium]|nr:Hint domain-containing protein [Rhodobacterales bacterium]